MAANDGKRTVEIELKLTGDLQSKISEISKGISGLVNAIKPLTGITDSISKISKSISSLKGNEPDLGKFSTQVSALSNIDTSKFTGVAAALRDLSKIKNLPDIGRFSKDLETLKKSSDGLRPENIGNLGFALLGFQGLKLPDGNRLISFAKGIKGFQGLSLNATAVKTLNGIAIALPRFAGSVAGLPTEKKLSSFANGLRSLSSVKTFTSANVAGLERIALALPKFANIKGFPTAKKLQGFASGIRSLSKLKITKATATNLAYFAEALKRFSGIGKLPNITDFVKSMKLVSGVKIPSLKKLTTEVSQLAKAFYSLSAVANIISTLQRVSGAVAKSGVEFDRFGKTVQKTSGIYGNFVKRLQNYAMYRVIADAIMGMQTAFRAGVQGLFEYDQALKDLQAITSATEGQVEQMGVVILDVAARTKFSAAEIATGMRTLGQAGFSAQEAMGAMEGIANLATGTLSTMEESVDLVSTALRVYSEDNLIAGDAADVFANAVNKSKLTIDKVRTAFNYIGPIAKNAGISFQESATALAVLANSGLKASKIGTGLRRVMAELVDPSDKLAQAAARVGVSIEDLNPKNQKFSDVLKSLSLVVEDSTQAFQLFGKRGAAAVLTLTKDTNQFLVMETLINKSGTAAEMAAIQVEGLAVKFKNLQDKLGVLVIKLGEAGLTEALRVLLTILQELVDILIYVADSAIGKFIIQTTLMTAGLAVATKGIYLFRTALAVTTGTKFIGFLTSIATTLPLIGKYAKTASAGIIGIRTATAAAALSGTALAGTTAATGTAAVGAAGGFAALSAALLPLAGFVAIVGALALAVKGLYSAYKDVTQGHAEAAKEAAKEVEALDTNIDAIERYKQSVSEVEVGSDKYRQTNKDLRSELLKVASEQSKLTGVALNAAKSIEPVTGYIIDQGEALALYQQELDKVKFDKLAEVSLNTEAALTEVGNFFTRFRAARDNEWRYLAEETKVGWQRIKAVFTDDDTEIESALALQSERMTAAFSTSNLIDKIKDGTATFDEWQQAVSAFDPKTATSGLEKIKERFLLMQTEVTNSLIEFSKIEDFSFEMSREELISFLLEQKKITNESGVMAEAYVRAYDRITQATRAASQQVKGSSVKIITKQDLDDQLSSLEAAQEKALSEIEVFRSMDEANLDKSEQAKYAIIKDFYTRSLAAAIAYRDDLEKNNPDNAEGIRKANQQIEEIQAASYLKLLDMSKKHYKDLDNADKSIESAQKRRSKEHRRHDKYLSSIRKLESKASSKISDIWSKYSDKRKKLIEDLSKFMKTNRSAQLAAEKALRDKINGLDDSLEDKIRKRRQEGMTDRQRAADDQNAYSRKVRESEDLISEGIRKNDKGLIERGKQKAQQAQDLAEGFKKQSDSINGMTRSNDLLKKSEQGLKKISDLERENDVRKKIRDTNKQISDARKGASSDVAKVTTDLQKQLKEKKLLIAEELGANKTYYKTVEAAEKARHNKEISNIDAEIAKHTEKARVYSEMAKGVTVGNTPEISGPITEEANKATDALKDVGVAWDDTINEMVGKSTQQKAALVEPVKAAKEATTELFKHTTESGEVVYSNLQAVGNGFSELGDTVKTEALGPMEDMELTIGRIEGKSVNVEVTDNTKNVVDNLKEVEGITKEPATMDVKAETTDAKAKIAEMKEGVPKKIDIPFVISGYDNVTDQIKQLGDSEVVVDVSFRDGDQNIITVLKDAQTILAEISDNEYALVLKIDKTDLDSVSEALKNIQDTSINISVAVSGIDVMNKLSTWMELVEANKRKDVEANVEIIGLDRLILLKTTLEALANKYIKITAEVVGLNKVLALKKAIDSVNSKSVTVSSSTVSKRAEGGYIEKYAGGGSVFKRLANRYISSGSGTKDDVPALLWKGEFVHKVNAVKKYGRRFMEMVNNGMFPVSLARQGIQKFASGGPVGMNIVPKMQDFDFVQKFASGGAVVNGMVGRLKKKLFEMLGMSLEGDGANMSIGNLNLTNSIATKANNITSELGQSSIAAMSETLNNAVTKLANGGNITSDIAGMNAQRDIISDKYSDEIKKAKASGNSEIAKILSRERADLIILALELKKELKAAKDETEAQIKERKLKNSETNEEINSSYKRSYDDEMKDYNDQVYDDNTDYSRTEADYKRESKSDQEDYARDISGVESEFKTKADDYYSELVAAKKELDEKVKKLHASGRLASNIGNINDSRVYTGESSFYMNKNHIHKPYELEGTVPSFEQLAQMGEFAFSHGERGLGEKGKSDYMKQLEERWASYRETLNLFDKFNVVDPSIFATEYDTSSLIRNLEAQGLNFGDTEFNSTKDVEYFLAKNLSEIEKKSKLNNITSDFVESKTDRDLDWTRYKEDHSTESERRDIDHAQALSDMKLNKTTSLDEEKKSFDKDMEGFKSTLIKRTEDITKQSEDNITSRKDQTVDELQTAKDTLSENVKSLENSMNSDLKKSQIQVNEEDHVPSPISVFKDVVSNIGATSSNAIEELLKKLRIPRFNTGGMIPHSPGSIPGKDSVLFSGTPGEVVVREPAARLFGYDFFEAINNFRMPKPQLLNSGGVVGTIRNNIDENFSMKQVSHALELTLNGKQYEPLTGSGANIESLIDDLKMAKRRSN